MKLNPDKCHLVASCDDEMSIYVNNYNKTNSKCENHLGNKIDHRLNFNTHIDEIREKAGWKKVEYVEWHIPDPVKHLRWSVLQK